MTLRQYKTRRGGETANGEMRQISRDARHGADGAKQASLRMSDMSPPFPDSRSLA